LIVANTQDVLRLIYSL